MKNNELAVIKIKRTPQIGTLASYNIFIDGKEVGKIWVNQERIYEVQPGKHTAYIKVQWYQSKAIDLNLNPGQTIELTCGYRITGLRSAFGIESPYYLELNNLSQKPLPDTQFEPEISIHIGSEEERVPSATEEIHVPRGVSIKVKRSRTIEHTISIDEQITGEAGINIGMRQILAVSIRGELERKQGRSYQRSETIEYEVELKGETHSRYKLVWTDIWRRGVVEFKEGKSTRIAPFQFLEKAELEVIPVEHGETHQ